MANVQIRFLPENREASVGPEATILDAARAADVYIGSVCSGDGTCGRCRVLVREGSFYGGGKGHLPEGEALAGFILACQARPLGDMVVEVPPESRLVGYGGTGKEMAPYCESAPGGVDTPAGPLMPLLEVMEFTLSEPTADDPSADLDRLLSAVSSRRGRPATAGLDVARRLPRLLRRLEDGRPAWRWTWKGRVAAFTAARGAEDEVFDVRPAGGAGPAFGIALDVGTTSVVAHLVDLATGATRATAAMYNSQIRYGADVISRINHARRPGGAEALHQTVLRDSETLIQELARRAGIRPADILGVSVAGNTIMMHFLLGLEADLIRLSPFVPAAMAPREVPASEAGLRIHPRGFLYTMPMAGGYVGGDITADVLVSGMHEKEELALLLDMGTNGEIVLGNRDFLVSCSASAGPAFEGGSVICGMRAAPGAVDSVRIAADGSASVTTIGQAPPVGICGTGLIDALAELFRTGLVDRSGRFLPDRAPGRFRVSREDGRPEYILVPAKASGTGHDIILGPADLENLIRTKASIYAAAESLVTSLDLSLLDVRRIYIAGAFGSHLDVERCVSIGLLPHVPGAAFQFIGNGAVEGAKLVLRDRRRMEEVGRIIERMTYRDLMGDAAYMERFTSACFLPHTDVGLFPPVEAGPGRRA